MNLKLLRLTAWLLLLATLITLLSGFYSLKPYLAPWLSPNLARQLHYGVMILIFIFLFYLHSLTGIFHLIARYKLLRHKAVKIIIAVLWTGLLMFFICYFFTSPSNPYGKVSLPNIANTNQANLNTATLTAKAFTSDEVAKHNNANDCWLIISNKVYDLTNYLNQHPGNAATILPYCGQDGTQGYATKDRGQSHSAFAASLLPQFYLGDLSK
jgi:hypothetical protein